MLNVSDEDFPVRKKYCYLSAANVSPTYNESTKAIFDWQNDLLLNGAVNFND